MRALNIAATGMMAQQTNVDVISNNIANMSTTAFKRQKAEFQDLLYQNITRAGTNSSDEGTIVPTGIQLGLGVKTGSVYRINEQGPVVETGNDLDVAISGKGYFQVNLPTGTQAFTRAGNFQVNADGDLVTSQGYVVSPGISIPQDAANVDINEDGQVMVKIDGQPAPQTVGQLDLVNFVNEAGLEAEGNNLFTETEASGAPLTGLPGDEGFGTVLQNFIEMSNVDSVSEITTLITAQRAYELNSRVISTSDEMLQTISNIR